MPWKPYTEMLLSSQVTDSAAVVAQEGDHLLCKPQAESKPQSTKTKLKKKKENVSRVVRKKPRYPLSTGN
jgi:hypothetical protein